MVHSVLILINNLNSFVESISTYLNDLTKFKLFFNSNMIGFLFVLNSFNGLFQGF